MITSVKGLSVPRILIASHSLCTASAWTSRVCHAATAHRGWLSSQKKASWISARKAALTGGRRLASRSVGRQPLSAPKAGRLVLKSLKTSDLACEQVLVCTGVKVNTWYLQRVTRSKRAFLREDAVQIAGHGRPPAMATTCHQLQHTALGLPLTITYISYTNKAGGIHREQLSGPENAQCR